MKKLPQETVNLSIDATSFDAKNLMFFDRCGIYPADTFIELHFGFYGEAQELQQGLIIIVAMNVVKNAQQNLLSYVEKAGQPEMMELPKCRLRGTGSNVVPADFIGLAQMANVEGEILFHTFSSKVAIERARSGSSNAPVAAICSALLRCSVDLQKRWVIGLYENIQD